MSAIHDEINAAVRARNPELVEMLLRENKIEPSAELIERVARIRQHKLIASVIRCATVKSERTMEIAAYYMPVDELMEMCRDYWPINARAFERAVWRQKKSLLICMLKCGAVVSKLAITHVFSMGLNEVACELLDRGYTPSMDMLVDNYRAINESVALRLLDFDVDIDQHVIDYAQQRGFDKFIRKAALRGNVKQQEEERSPKRARVEESEENPLRRGSREDEEY